VKRSSVVWEGSAMLTREENEILTRVGPGTPMGTLMRRYWVPALLDRELPEPDCPPVETRLLGEELVAFRQTDGRVVIVEAYCPHRRASLFWGRNEENGIRCVYHGWKFDAGGRCVDMPSEPAESTFKDKIAIASYPTFETGGVIWCYMGPPERQPPPPVFRWTQVPDTYRGVSRVWQESNWLQALEGGIDTVHGDFLHRGKPPGQESTEETVRGRAANISHSAKVEVVSTAYGYAYAGIRDAGDAKDFVRAYHWIAPWNQIRGYTLAPPHPYNSGHMWVPMDDENTMVFNWTYSLDNMPLTDAQRRLSGSGNELGVDIDIENGFRAVRNKRNRYLIDRQVQRTRTYTGIEGVNTQDRAVQESMGVIADRSLEHLGTTDQAIIATRRILLQAVKTVEDGGDPPGLDEMVNFLRAGESVLPHGASWFDEMRGFLFLMEQPAETDA
jgi:phenylpropionate dioxygenase-like ring-hydroxylating dioxygenase large terminal subunit